MVNSSSSLVGVLVLELVSGRLEVLPCSRSNLGTSKTLGRKPFEDEAEILALTLEVAWLINIGYESRLLRLPAQYRSGSIARGRDIHARERR
jgi:hypothetical protein